MVVDLPLVPVMPTKRAREPAARTALVQQLDVARGSARPPPRARRGDRVRLRQRCGMPGESTSASNANRPSAGFAHREARGCGRARGVPDGRPTRSTSAPHRASARAAGRPFGRGRPRRSACRRTGAGEHAHRIFSVARPDQGQDHRDDPEPDHDGRLRPALLLEMVVQRRHQEHARAGALVPEHLDDDRDGLDDEQAADDHQHDLMLGRHRDARRARRPGRGCRYRP